MLSLFVVVVGNVVAVVLICSCSQGVELASRPCLDLAFTLPYPLLDLAMNLP